MTAMLYKPRKSLFIFAFLLVLGAGVIAAASATQQSQLTAALPPKPKEPLTIATPRDRYAFSVEVVSSSEDMRKGLMFREEVPEKTGMLFDFGNARRISMWMKNTIVPLDMIFIREDGEIVDIAEHTTPFSLEPITSELPALAVLEVMAGTCNHYGIQKGDKVEHPLFKVRP